MIDTLTSTPFFGLGLTLLCWFLAVKLQKRTGLLVCNPVLVAAMLPVALGGGPGAASRATMAVVIIGGQTLSLLITLLITPVAYSLFDDFSSKVKSKIHRDHPASPSV